MKKQKYTKGMRNQSNGGRTEMNKVEKRKTQEKIRGKQINDR